MPNYNLTVSDYRKIWAKREEQSMKHVEKEINDHQENSMVTITDKDTIIIQY